MLALPIAPASGVARAGLKAGRGGKAVKVGEKIAAAAKHINLNIYSKIHAGQVGKIISKKQIATTLVKGTKYIDVRNMRRVKYDGKIAVIHVKNMIISAHRYSKPSKWWRRAK